MQQDHYSEFEQRHDIAPTRDERNIAILAHVLTFFAPILAPLIIYLIKKDESPFIAFHAKESLNFQITLVIVILILVFTLIGILFIGLVGIIALFMVIIATIKASDGKWYKYPFNIRLIK